MYTQCVLEKIENATHFLLNWPNHHCARNIKINEISRTISRQSNSTITKTLLFGDNKLEFEINKNLLIPTIESISLIEGFSCSLFE